jgi:choline dehydrogenase-like flavoprotein
LPDSVVHSIIYDDSKGKAAGVKVIHRVTKAVTEYYAKIIFVNAATLNTNLILLNSTSNRFPDGLSNDNGLLGKYIAFQNYRGDITATFEGHEDSYYYGRRPTAVMMPNFRNVHRQETDFKRGYMVFYTATRQGWGHGTTGPQIGAEYKDAITVPGKWGIYMMMQGETLPKENNNVYLSKTEKDQWGIPLLTTSVAFDENDDKLVKDFLQQGAEMLEKAGCKNISANDNKESNPGLDIHEIGGVRMGKDPATSLVNQWNQLHHCPNVFVTDGACMASTGVQNPSLTFMALTARAANYAIAEFKKGAFKS